MRLIAYFRSSDDPHLVRDRLRSAHPSAQVVCRAGWLPLTWESGFDAVYAPGYPGIQAAYADRGAVVLDDLGPVPVRCPRTLEEVPLSTADPVTILCAGPSLPQTLKDWQPQGLVIAVNRAIHWYPGADWYVANDGFSLPGLASDTRAIRSCRALHADTVPSGSRWFPLDKVGITDGLWSSSCALILAGRMQPRTVYIAGHDCIPGPGCMGAGTERDAQEMASVRARAEQEIQRLCADGVVVLTVPTPAPTKKGKRRG